MSFVRNLGLAVLVGGTAAVGALAATGNLQNRLSGFDHSGLFGLTAVGSVVGVNAAAPASGGPIDKNFNAKRVHLDKLVASVELVTSPVAGPIRIQASGNPETLKELAIRVVGDQVLVRLDKDEEEAWFPWNLFNMWSRDRKVQDLRVRIYAPTGTPYEIEDMVGTLNAGDLDAPLDLEGASLSARIGRVQSAKISIAGSGRIIVGAIKGALDLEVAGSGDFQAASASTANIEIAGGGEVNIGPLTNGFSAAIAGSGDVRVASVNGPVDIEIAGSGDVQIDAGTAKPFEVEIAGSGDVVFKGHAVDPSVEIYGSGSVHVNSYSGTKTEEIAGSGDFTVTNPVPPPAPATPAPAQ